ncbi:MAG: Stp1/IreP family PP2C-type Ser/Thr phosphatase, partial [Nitrospirae bacterium]|nr:Stp1/IreP family PP2C-type Ser/Thr phosphatase [Nitrospirota bacterium]
MEIRVSGNTHIGMMRGGNEDAYGVYPELSLYIVADGLGGHAGGEVASRMAVEIVKEEMASAFADAKGSIVEAIKTADSGILRKAKNEHSLYGMGTTIVVLKIEGDKATVAHVGDSRAYLIRDNAITQLTRDHTVVEEYVRMGLLTAKDMAYHPSRHTLSRALGTADDMDVDVADVQLKIDDTMLLCTDGLTNMLPDHEILSTVCESRPSPEKITERLISLANRNGGV